MGTLTGRVTPERHPQAEVQVGLQAQVEATLVGLDRDIASTVGEPGSLAPGQCRATSMRALGTQLVGTASHAWQEAFADALQRVVRAQLQHFPRNLYWDQDFMAAEMVRLAQTPAMLDRHARQLAELQARFGEHSSIRFRYLHDFSYGFDWARWVTRSPVERREVSPFDPRYLDDLLDRGRDIQRRIAAGEAGFPEVPQGGARNPFPFSREPEHEARLLGDLACHGLIPVPSWKLAACPRWQLPFGAHRVARARALALPSGPQAGWS